MQHVLAVMATRRTHLTHLSCQHVVQDHPRTPNIHTIRIPTGVDLRRGVPRRAHHRLCLVPVLRSALAVAAFPRVGVPHPWVAMSPWPIRVRVCASEGTRDSEVRERDVAVRIDEDIVQLDVAVHDAFLVQVLEGDELPA